MSDSHASHNQQDGSTFSRDMVVCTVLGFSSGLPLFVLINLLSAWLKTNEVDIKAIGLFALVGIPYTWKFLWSPLMDRFQVFALGRRRGWMLVTQLIVMIAIAMVGQLSPQTDLTAIVVVCGLIAFFSASQDIVVDAYRRERLSDVDQAAGTAVFVNAYKLSTLVPGALALILSDHLPWSAVFLITALFMLPGMLTVLLVDEPKLTSAPPHTLRDAVVLPFKAFVERHGWAQVMWLLAFIFLYKLGDSMATALATPFYMDLGFSRTDIGIVAKNAGLWASLAGGILGAIWMKKTGVNRALWIFGLAQAFAILGFAVLAKTGTNLWVLGWVIGMEAFAVGLGTAAFTAFIAQSTDIRYTATQFALFTSLSAIPRTFINAMTGFIVAHTGWFTFFLICTLLAVPGLLLLPKVAPWRGEKRLTN